MSEVEFFKWHEVYKQGNELTEVMICGFTAIVKVTGYAFPTGVIVCVSLCEIDKESAIGMVRHALKEAKDE